MDETKKPLVEAVAYIFGLVTTAWSVMLGMGVIHDWVGTPTISYWQTIVILWALASLIGFMSYLFWYSQDRRNHFNRLFK